MTCRHHLIAALVVLAALSPASAFDSLLLPRVNGQYVVTPVAFDGRLWRLLDFSYTGYRLGHAAPPAGVPCQEITLTGGGEIADALQTAVDTLGTSGGGVVALGPGSYTMAHSVAVPYDNVSIEGAGSASTLIQVPASYSVVGNWAEGLFTFGIDLGGWHKGWIDRGDVLTDVVGIVERGDTTVAVASTIGLAAGDLIVVRQYFGSAFSARNSGATDGWDAFDGWPDPTTIANRQYSFTYLREIGGIDGNLVSLDAPIPWKLDPADNPVKIQSASSPSWVRPVTNVGVSGLSIVFEDNLAGGSRPAGAGVYFEGVKDGWAFDVHVRNIPRFGFLIDSSARVTLLGCAAYEAQDEGGGGYGYGFATYSSQNVLIRRCYAERMRHNFTSSHALTSMLVYSENESALSRLGDDTHHSFVHAHLWDRHQLRHGSGMRAEHRGATSGGAYETNGSATLWNTVGDCGRGGWYGGSLHLNPSADGQSIVVGGPGAHGLYDGNTGDGDPVPPSAGLQVGPNLESPGLGSKDRNVLYEAVGRNPLLPASLYREQLRGRVGEPQDDFVGACGNIPLVAPFARATAPQPIALLFDGDHLGWTPIVGSVCQVTGGGTEGTLCHAGSTERNHTPSGARSFLVTATGNEWDVLLRLRGCPLSTGDFQALGLWVFPESAGLELLVGLQLSGYPEDTNSSLGFASVGGLVSGQWSYVEVPMATFGSGTYNMVDVRSGDGAEVRFFIDDVSLVGPTCPEPQPVVLSLSKSSGTARLEWPAQPPGAGFEVVGSWLSSLRRDQDVSEATCLADDLDSALWEDADTDPPPLEGVYYLVRARTSCAHGDFGVANPGVQRGVYLACP